MYGVALIKAYDLSCGPSKFRSFVPEVGILTLHSPLVMCLGAGTPRTPS